MMLLLPLVLSSLISFSQLNNVQEYPVKVQMRGFLYTHEGDYFLAEQPNLKSCCIKKSTYIHVKNLKGNFSTSKAYLVEGTLTFSSGYTLENAKIVEEKISLYPFLLLGIFFIFLVCFKKYLF